MKIQVIAVAAALLLMPLIGMAQENPGVLATIPFGFVADGIKLPAGHYEFKLKGMELNTLIVRDTKTDHAIMLPIIAPAGLSPNSKAQIVFDKEGKSRVLSEVVIPGMDGYVLTNQNAPTQETIVPALK
jgi:hypothetical protein